MVFNISKAKDYIDLSELYAISNIISDKSMSYYADCVLHHYLRDIVDLKNHHFHKNKQPPPKSSHRRLPNTNAKIK